MKFLLVLPSVSSILSCKQRAFKGFLFFMYNSNVFIQIVCIQSAPNSLGTYDILFMTISDNNFASWWVILEWKSLPFHFTILWNHVRGSEIMFSTELAKRHKKLKLITNIKSPDKKHKPQILPLNSFLCIFNLLL